MKVMKRIAKWFAIISCVVIIAWQWFLHNHRLAFVPKEMQVSSILFAEEDSWGFGPGGNEAGFIMYALPDEIAIKAKTEGLTYLSSFPSAKLGKPHGWQGKYEEWHTTPIDPKRSVPLAARRGNPECGFCIDISPDIIETFEKVITSPGNFYAYGRTGMIVIAPSIHKVFYLYAG